MTTNKEEWEERIKFAETPYEIKLDGKTIDNLDVLKDFIKSLLSTQEENIRREYKEIHPFIESHITHCKECLSKNY